MPVTLNAMQKFQGRRGPVVLLIMDGIGIGKPVGSNAVHLAKKPNLDRLFQSPFYRLLKAHGTAVGMPSEDDMGNSEVGHNALGAGRIFDQGASLVKKAIADRRIFQTPLWRQIVNRHSNAGTLHFLGLLSDGNVHAHIDHLFAMLKEAWTDGVQKVRIHTLLDGRDVGGRTALGFVERLEQIIREINDQGGDYAIASGGGRMLLTMDRYEADWGMVELGWKTHVLAEGALTHSAKEAIEKAYENPALNDQYLPAFVVAKNGEAIGPILDGDSVVLFNFRGDRAIEISRAFCEKNFSKFDRKRLPDVLFVGMMQYDGDLKIPEHFLVNPPAIENPISVYFAAAGIRSFAISETQKYGHVTYFWNGNNSGYIDQKLEQFVEIPSDRIPFDQRPEMKAYEITEKTIALLKSGQFDFGRVNFPNGDMVGHTGNLDATIRSVEVTDECVGKIVEAVNDLGGVTVILADHGNADEMFTENNGVRTPKTSHTLNPVPFVIVDAGFQGEYRLSNLREAGLANVAATLCNLLGYEKPGDYEPSLIAF